MHYLILSVQINTHTQRLSLSFLPSLLLLPEVPTACSDIVHSSIAASPGSEAMVFSLTPRQSPSASLSLSPLLLPHPHSPSLQLTASSSLSLCSLLLLLLVSQGWRESESRALRRDFACVCEGCELIGLELEAASVALFNLPAPSCTHTYIDRVSAGRRREGGTAASVRTVAAN